MKFKPMTDRRLWICAAAVGMLLALFVVVGMPLLQTGELPAFSRGGVLAGAAAFIGCAAVATALVVAAYCGAERLAAGRPAETEGRFSRVLGNGFAVFALLLICWLPVWLAFYPGVFSYDAATQFYEYIYEDMYPHHPLLHTLLLGACMGYGIDACEAGVTAGVALYCAVQMVLLAAMLAYACHWLRRRKAPLWARVCVTLLFALFPFFSMWSFFVQKDVLFGGLVLLMALQLIDLWKDGARKPVRMACFGLTAVLMMLMRNNGIYALALLLPFIIGWARGMRVRLTALLAGAMALYLLANAGLMALTNAGDSDSQVEMLSIPLQQLCRAMIEDENALAPDETEYMDVLYPEGFTQYYEPLVADPVKWAMDSEKLELATFLPIWARVGIEHPQAYAEAFLKQNLAYYLPYAPMPYYYDFGPDTLDSEALYVLDRPNHLPWLKNLYTQWGDTLRLGGVPGVRLLSDTALYVWLMLAAFGLAVYRRDKAWMAALGLLIAIWLTCLLGPVAIIRYLLGIIYTMPVLLAGLLAPRADG